MKKLSYIIVFLFVYLFAPGANPNECDGKCISNDQVVKIVEALDELDNIHQSPVEIEFVDELVVIRDESGRVYTNGGDKNPLRLKIKIGNHIDRDMLVVIKPRIWYRPDPEPSMFRLRIRAQAGILVPELIKTINNDNDNDNFWDAGIGWDFFQLWHVNMSLYTGVRSSGIGPGIDLTKNFGIYTGYSFIYDGFSHSIITSAYFSFN